MDGSPTAISWIPISALAARFKANVAALATRDSELAHKLTNHYPKDTYHILAEADSVRLGTGRAGDVRPLSNPVPPAGVQQLLSQLSAGQQLAGPLVVAGLDHGWLWDALSKLDIKVPTAPGHRTPIYLLAPDIERLWVVLHLHDWRTMLADRGCIILAGRDAADQLQQFLIDHPEIAWPRTAITTDASVWPAGRSLDTTLAAADARIKQLLDDAIAKIERHRSDSPCVATIAARFRSGTPLRILGITSRYTTFLQHSMRDWLAGMESLGHSTQLLIEQHDHERPHPLLYLSAIADFQPDLILLIDHYRAELPKMPTHIPCVMWVQDRLPNIFSSKAGASQGPLDFCLGFGRLELSERCGYPAARYMPAQIGVNPARFARAGDESHQPTKAEVEAYGCDVSYVGHASTPADRIVADAIAKQPDRVGQRLFEDVFEQMRAAYEGDRAIAHALTIRRMITSTAARLGARISPHELESIYDFFNNRVNNAMFRHQALEWLADLLEAEPGLKINLWGNGWHEHPRFSRFARGPADNQTQLPGIYRASSINLQITPHGAVHQRLLEGLAAGGFFLVRYCAGDAVEPIYRNIWDWCRQRAIENDDALRRQADETINNALNHLRELLAVDPFDLFERFIDVLRLSADSEYIRSAQSVWPEEYPRIAFNSRESLHSLIRRYRSNPEDRQATAGAMRRTVLQRFSYAGISSRLLAFIASNLNAPSAAAPQFAAHTFGPGGLAA